MMNTPPSVADAIPSVNPQSSTNGYHNGHDAPSIDELMALAEAAHVTLEPEAEHVGEQNLLKPEAAAMTGLLDEPEPLTLLDEAQELADGDAAKQWALDNIEDIARLARANQARLYATLNERGLSQDWINRDLKPSVKASAKVGKADGRIWTDYVNAARDLGYTFRLCVLEDTLQCNGEPMSGPLEDEILVHLHARGFKDVELARRSFTTDARQRQFHPVKEFLQSLKWDGNDHIAKLASHFTDEHDPITYSDNTQRTVLHAFLRRWLIGAAAKVFIGAQNPMLVLAGGQGKGKSHFVKWLAGDDVIPEMHFEGAIKPEDKDYLRYLTTRWVWEVSELGVTMRKADVEALKAFLTLQMATYRPAHGRYVLNKPALASFIGTVNPAGSLLNDPTGARRFRIVELADIDWTYDGTIDPHQVWAQAYALWKQGETWNLSSEEKTTHAAITEMYQAEDPFEGVIRESFDIDPERDEWFMSTIEILRKLGKREDDRSNQMKVSTTMRILGLKRKRRQHNGIQQMGYVGIKWRDTFG